MAAAKLKLTIEQGATFEKVITWKAGTPAVPVDLTGCTALMHVRAEIADLTPLIVLSTENGGIVLGGVLGTVTLRITADATAALNWTTGVYDLEVIYPDTRVRRLLAGAVSVSREVTRP